MALFRRKSKPPEPQALTVEYLDGVASKLTQHYEALGYAALMVRAKDQEIGVLGGHLPATTGELVLRSAAEIYAKAECLPKIN